VSVGVTFSIHASTLDVSRDKITFNEKKNIIIGRSYHASFFYDLKDTIQSYDYLK
jgi:hypothetical protein